MASIDEVQVLLRDILERLRLLEQRVVAADQVQINEGLSDLSDNFGIIKAGEIRFGTGEPGQGFTGLRIARKGSGMLYGSTDYLMAGVDSDTLLWGIRSSDGSLDEG